MPLALLSVVGCTENKRPIARATSDKVYMRTGFYFLAKEEGIEMKEEDTGRSYLLDSIPFVSRDNVTEVTYRKASGDEEPYDEICLILDDKGFENLKNVTDNSTRPRMAVVLANRLLYIVTLTHKITTREMCLYMDFPKEKKDRLFEEVKSGK